jgi:predicted metal-dependent phosphoesterase TrpH
MALIYDLHSHTRCSDGTLTPTELVERANEKGVDVLALTDHDVLAGIPEATKRAEELGMMLVPGVEISVTWRRQTIHIVGLNVDIDNPALIAGLESLRVQRDQRAQRIAHKLENCGIENALQATIDIAGCDAITRTHFARLIIERGRAKDMQEVFKKWLGRKGKGYVSGSWCTLEEAVGWICQAGGQAVIAHPARYNLTGTKLGELISEFKEYGGTAIEVASSSHNVAEKAKMGATARRHGLLASVGSDFHNPGHPRVELGYYLKLPDGVEPVWTDWTLSESVLQRQQQKAAGE